MCRWWGTDRNERGKVLCVGGGVQIGTREGRCCVSVVRYNLIACHQDMANFFQERERVGVVPAQPSDGDLPPAACKRHSRNAE